MFQLKFSSRFPRQREALLAETAVPHIGFPPSVEECLAEFQRLEAPERPRRSGSIVLMDGPTSGLDPETDARISEILRTTLRDKTVLAISHRRESLGNYDRFIEMQNGRIGESSNL